MQSLKRIGQHSPWKRLGFELENNNLGSINVYNLGKKEIRLDAIPLFIWIGFFQFSSLKYRVWWIGFFPPKTDVNQKLFQNLFINGPIMNGFWKSMNEMFYALSIFLFLAASVTWVARSFKEKKEACRRIAEASNSLQTTASRLHIPSLYKVNVGH